MIYELNGIKVKLQAIDLDGDGITGSIENVKQVKSSNDWVSVKETTELGEALSHQNKDEENTKGMNSVDFISRINSIQHASMSAVTYIARAHVISMESRDLIVDLMRKAVSLDGKGRQEFVAVVTGHNQNQIDKARSAVSNVIGGAPK